MGTFLAAIDSLPETARWAKVREPIFTQPLPFFEELRRDRPIWRLPQLTLVTRFADCSSILRLHDAFGVDLYELKQGAYFMAQDDTAAHWRQKSIMKTVLDREDIPAIRDLGWRKDTRCIDWARNVEVVSSISRAVPIALVQEWFGFAGADPAEMKDWSYWNQQDAFWNQPFDSAAVPDQAAIVSKREAANVKMAIWLASSSPEGSGRETLAAFAGCRVQAVAAFVQQRDELLDQGCHLEFGRPIDRRR